MWRLALYMLMDRPLLCRVANHKELSEMLKKCISNLKKFYKYLKNLEIFFLHVAMCSEVVSHYVQNYYSLTLLVPSSSSV